MKTEMSRKKLHKLLLVFTEIIILLFLLVIFNFTVWAQNFNEADGRNARNIALGSSQGISKTNTLQALNPGIGTPQFEVQIQESAKNLAIQSSKKQTSATVPLAQKNKIGESWYAGETLISGIGQGFVLTNPLCN